MAGWVPWRRLTSKTSIYTLDLPDSPGCYELALGKSRNTIHTVYVGKTAGTSMGIRKRADNHANIVKGDPFWRKARAAENKGYYMWLRYIEFPNAKRADAEELRHLARWWRYPWNTRGTPWSGYSRIR